MLKLFIFCFLFAFINCDYIRSNELVLDENIDAGSELINLNKLILNEKGKDYMNKNYLFKLVDDTLLVSYIDLKYLNADTTLIVLKKKINYEDICENGNKFNHAETNSAEMNDYTSCLQSLKIVAINENDFIEIPIEIRKINTNKKLKLNLSFSQINLNLNATQLTTSYLVEPAFVTYDPALNKNAKIKSAQFELLNTKIEYIIENDSIYKEYFDVSFSKEFQSANKYKIKLNVMFKNENSMIKAFETSLVFNIKLVASLSINKDDQVLFNSYELVTNVSNLNVFVKVSDVKEIEQLKESKMDKLLKPLDFEYPIYSIAVENNLNTDDVLLQPKLKDGNGASEIVFSLFQNELNNNQDSLAKSTNFKELPFYVDETTGVIKLKKLIYESEYDESGELSFSSMANLNNDEKFYSFGIKATYKKLASLNTSQSLTSRSESANYYYDYMIPAFAKVQISVKKEQIKAPVIHREIISPFVSKYEILNEESNNQTIILYINDPIELNSKLIKLIVDNKTSSSFSNKRLEWLINDADLFKYDAQRKDQISNVTISNIVEFKDQNTYRTTLKIIDKLNTTSRNGKKNRHHRVLTEIKLEFRVDYDLLLFEKSEYSVSVSETDLLSQNLIRISVKQRQNKYRKIDYSKNVLFRIQSNEPSKKSIVDEDFFEINPTTGWISAKRLLTNKNYYELVVVGVNTELQKSATAKVKIYVDCYKNKNGIVGSSSGNKHVKFSLFENSPNRTRIGTLTSVCSDPNYLYYINNDEIYLKICTHAKKYVYLKNELDASCNKFILDMSKLENLTRANVSELVEHKLFDLDLDDGYLMTNDQIGLNLLLSLIKDDKQSSNFNFESLLLGENENMYDFNTISLLLKVTIKRSIFNVEISMQNTPKLFNFHDVLAISELNEARNELNSTWESNICLYNYKFTMDNDELFGEPNNSSNIISLARFVKIDQSSAHLEAEFKQSDCLASFFIHNNGCLTLKYDHLNQIYSNQSAIPNKCLSNYLSNSSAQSNLTDYMILKAGSYNIEFKLCYHDSNKVSCSSFYNQTITISKDLYKSSRIIATVQNQSLEQMSLRSKPLDILSNASYTFILLGLAVALVLIGLAVIITLIVVFAKPKSNNKKSTSSEKSFVLPSKLNTDFKNSDVSSIPSSRLRTSSNNTPETGSDAATTSSKISKTDDENEDIVKIQVSDDYLGVSKDLMPKYGYTNNNFCYAGSFSSINSSCESNRSDDFKHESALKATDDLDSSSKRFNFF